MNLILASDKVLENLSGISSSQVKLGLKGYTGNKGAIAFSFEILGESFCMVNSHLAAHKQNCKLRNENILNISRGLRFNLPKTSKSIFEHDHIFWFGDLNYRIDTLTTEKIIKKIAIGDFESCLIYDQLNLVRKKNNILSDFNEGTIDFLPTFKYLIGSNQHNVKRDPAWCDRVLWKGPASLSRYGSCDSIKTSDHKPVFASFSLELHKKDLEKMNAVRNTIYKEIDELHHAAMPKALISTHKIVFEKIRYKHQYKQSFEITNSGKSSFTFEISEEKWIKCTPKTYFLSAQETVLVNVLLQINLEFLRQKRNDKGKLADFLLVKILQGQDFFVEIECCVFDTFIGYSCDLLCRKMPSVEYHDLPNPLVRIIEYLKKKGLREKKLFETRVEEVAIAEVIEKIDQNEEFDESISAFAVAAALQEFLKSLEEPIVSVEVVDTKIAMVHIIGFNHVRVKVLEALKPANASCFKYITDFMKKLIGNSIYNGVSSTQLANSMFNSIFQLNSRAPEIKNNRVLFLEMFFYGG